MYVVSVVTHVCMTLVMAIVLFGSIQECFVARMKPSPFLWLLGADVVMCACTAAKWSLLGFVRDDVSDSIYALFVVATWLSYISYFMLLSSFVYFVVAYISEKTRVSFLWAHITVPIEITFMLGYCVSVFNGMFFAFKDGAMFHGPLYALSGIGGYVVVLVTVYLLVRYHRYLRMGDICAVLSFIVLPLLVEASQPLRAVCSMQVALSFSILCIYCFIHIQQAHRYRRQEIRLTQDRIAIMLSQVSPHFIFNVLNTMYVLCDKDTQLVKQAIDDFSKYLRGNLEALENENEIAVEQELNYVHHYLNLEKLRFQEDLRVVYDIQETAFKIPPFTLQPLVENAVKHGLLQKKGGGTVTLSSRLAGAFYEITVHDDGVGFDVDVAMADDRTHIGIRNVRERLWAISDGTLDIKSARDGGTTATIQIPVNRGGVF